MNLLTLTPTKRRFVRELTSVSTGNLSAIDVLIIALTWGPIWCLAIALLIPLVAIEWACGALARFVWYMNQGSRLMRLWFALFGVLLVYLVLR